MQIFFKNIGNHLPSLIYPDSPTDVKSISGSWLWVVHPAKSAKSFLDDKFYGPNATECLDRGGAILFIKGTRYAGMGSEAEAVALERKHTNRIHCLRVACDGSSPKVIERIRVFLEKIARISPHEPIPWKEVEPAPWPENLVAIYLVLLAMKAAPNDAEKIRAGWNELDSAWRQRLWENAWEEYREERVLTESEWKAAHLPVPGSKEVDFPEPSNISKALETVKLSFSAKSDV